MFLSGDSVEQKQSPAIYLHECHTSSNFHKTLFARIFFEFESLAAEKLVTVCLKRLLEHSLYDGFHNVVLF